jgi:acetyltransferase-like isoleucine patch superfamily enzyme/dTDP-4-dehydrorhamnose 3,5-epimerase-like enzyme
MAFFKHETALVESSRVGEGTRIGAFAHVLEGARIGQDCELCDHTFVENDVILGDRVTVKCGVQLWDGTRIEDDVYIGPNATFSNGVASRGQHAERLLTIAIKRGASVGANATILPGLTIGEYAMIGAGTVVTNSVPRHAVVTGNPGRIVSYVGLEIPPASPAPVAPGLTVQSTLVEGVVLHRLPIIDDLRGRLSFAEVERNVPFAVKRYFLVFEVPTAEVRGEHAHRAQHQFLVCVHGHCCIVADDGTHRQEFLLDSPAMGIYVPPMTWAVQYKYSADAVLLALSSGAYDPADYIRDYQDFLALRKQGRAAAAATVFGNST